MNDGFNINVLHVIILLAFLICFGETNAQNESKILRDSNVDKSRLKLELFGSGVYYSIRYSRSIYHLRKWELQLNSGLSFFPVRIPNIMDYRSLAILLGATASRKLEGLKFEVFAGTQIAYHYFFDSRNVAVFGCCSDLFLLVPEIGVNKKIGSNFFVSIAYSPLILLDLSQDGDEWEGRIYNHFGAIGFGFAF